MRQLRQKRVAQNPSTTLNLPSILHVPRAERETRPAGGAKARPGVLLALRGGRKHPGQRCRADRPSPVEPSQSWWARESHVRAVAEERARMPKRRNARLIGRKRGERAEGEADEATMCNLVPTSGTRCGGALFLYDRSLEQEPEPACAHSLPSEAIFSNAASRIMSARYPGPPAQQPHGIHVGTFEAIACP